MVRFDLYRKRFCKTYPLTEAFHYKIFSKALGNSASA